MMNGELLGRKMVISGISQGSVMGPLLLVLCINDLSESVKLSILLFADNTKIFQQVSSKEDATLLKKDIDALRRRQSLECVVAFHHSVLVMR